MKKITILNLSTSKLFMFGFTWEANEHLQVYKITFSLPLSTHAAKLAIYIMHGNEFS